MIDGSMRPGTHRERLWGNTPVVLHGEVPQDRVADLYASLDVLLAPSIWPESFGLVVREALTQGLWVVASNRGALSQDISPGVNGFIIDVADSRQLTEILKALDADVARFKAAPPKPHVPLRTSVDQGREIAGLYQDIRDASERFPLPVSPSRQAGKKSTSK
jgi:glycosyltransferase involved in cell wall biosynthesis